MTGVQTCALPIWVHAIHVLARVDGPPQGLAVQMLRKGPEQQDAVHLRIVADVLKLALELKVYTAAVSVFP